MKDRLEAIARERLSACRGQINFALNAVRQGNPFAAERDDVRRERRLQSKVGLAPAAAAAVSQQIEDDADGIAESQDLDPPAMEAIRPTHADRRERIWGDTVDFVNVAFLERGAQVARSVGRIAYRNRRPQGSGVLIGAGLLLTNHHVIESARQSEAFVVEFDYEQDWGGQRRTVQRFSLDPSIFVTDDVDGLDFTIIGVGAAMDSDASLDEFGYSGLSDAPDKHMIGEFANIVQHPNGRFKEVVLRENRLVNRFDDALHYVADTEPGSSGSPVYNSEWRMIALHHWGGPWIDGQIGGHTNFEINEGIRISSIVRMLRRRLRHFSLSARRRIQSALDSGEKFSDATGTRMSASNVENGTRTRDVKNQSSELRVDANGRATWTFPIEFSVQFPQMSRDTDYQPEPNTEAPLDEPASHRDVAPGESESADYEDRKGYIPEFLEGFNIPLPELGPGIRDDVATRLNPPPGQPKYELKYHHFSVVVNRRRKLAFFTACNIDGATAKSIGRTSRNVSDLEPTDPGLREAVGSLQDAEADSWQNDPRISKDDYSRNEIYRNQIVPGFPNPRSTGRIRRMFQKGHLVRRIDPAWGSNTQALAAELDTFHWTNAAPQVGFFNQGRADEDQPGTGNGKLWRAAENYVLRNAVSENQRVTSFTGPIFRDDDRAYRNIQIPGAFFKLTCWVEAGNLRTLALIVDQQQVFDRWPEAIFNGQESLSGSEAFQDEDELDRVKDFLSTVEEIEELTELDFGDAVRNADIRKGEQRSEVTGEDDLPITSGCSRMQRGTRPTNLLATPDGSPDDLTRIKGVGQRLQSRLNECGVFHFRQILEWNSDEVRFMDEKLKARGRIERDQWVEQAARLS